MVCQALEVVDPAHRLFYEQNRDQYLQKLRALDERIRHKLKPYKGEAFLIFHPALGYYAQAYHLKQIPVEVDGKSPTSKQLAALIKFAAAHQLKTIFVPKQSGTLMARSVAEAIGGQILEIDPLAPAYIENLDWITDQLCISFKK